jgi:hypothetical protein
MENRYLGVDGKIILKRIFKKWDGLDCYGLGYGQLACSCERGNELSGSITCGKYLD